METFDRYVGQVFDGRYKILRIIGIGGMAVVFEAIDFATRRTVAVKMLKDDISGDAQSVKRFINESKAVSMLNHPNIVKIFDVSVRDNLKYIVMERVEGITLKNYITQKGALPLKEILNITEQILNALEHAHSKGIIHRDIKPQNIMLLKNGRIKVTDFGIAKLPNAETVTMTDKAIGTVFYISPEQASGKAIDPRSDLYSLGVMMYEMATGVIPFTAESPVSVALMQVSAQPKPPRERLPSIPVGLEQVILGAMEKKPERRFQSATQMQRHIAQLRSNPGYVFKVRRASNDTAPQLDKSASLPSERKGARNSRHRRQSHSMFPIISGVSAAFLIVIVLAAAFIFTRLFENSGVDKEKRLVVENFVGSTYSEAFKNDLEAGYYRVKVHMVYDSSYEENTIIGQVPDAGVTRKVIEGKQYCELELKVSMGAQTVLLQDYTIREWRTVESELKSLGIIVKKDDTTSEYHETVPEGYVIRTVPNAGTRVRAGDTVTLYVSRGEEIVYTIVPYFVGFDEASAMKALKESRLALGKVTYEYSDEVPAGSIMKQGRSAYIEVPELVTEIDFVISLGKKPEDKQ